jgi:transcriptional regulator with XRE-family HTH domain
MEARDIVKQLIDAGMTQVQIAERTGITQPTVSKILRGDVRDVMSQSYRRLAAVHAEVVGPRARKERRRAAV